MRIDRLERGTFLAPRVLSSPRDPVARVALIGIRMAMLAGDDVVVDVEVGPGACLEMVEPAAMVAYDAAGAPSSLRISAVLDEGAALLWRGAPFIVTDGANVRRSTNVRLAPGSRILLRETLVLGRSGQNGGRLFNSTRVRGADEELLAEDLDLTGALRGAPGVLGRAKTVGSLTAVGFRPDALAATENGVESAALRRLELACPGSVARGVAREVHPVETALDAVYAVWKRQALAGQRTAPHGPGFRSQENHGPGTEVTAGRA